MTARSTSLTGHAAWVAGLALCAVFSAGALQVRDTLHERHDASRTYEDVYYLPSPDVLNVMTLGYREAAADIIWMRALLYYTEQVSEEANGPYLMRYAQAGLRLDPDFKQLYTWSGMVPFYLMQGHRSVELSAEGVEILRAGSERYPNDGSMAWDLAATVRHEFLPQANDELSEDERRRYERMAQSAMARAVRLGAAPHWMVLNRAAEQSESGRLERAIRFVEMSLRSETSPGGRARLRAELQSLRQRQAVGEAIRDQASQNEGWRRDYPYVPLTLYLQLRERELPHVDDSR